MRNSLKAKSSSRAHTCRKCLFACFKLFNMLNILLYLYLCRCLCCRLHCVRLFDLWSFSFGICLGPVSDFTLPIPQLTYLLFFLTVFNELVYCMISILVPAIRNYNDWQRRREDGQKLNGLDDATKEQLKIHKDQDGVCPICLKFMSSAKITRCGHYFHYSCLRKLLLGTTSCPMCRRKIIRNEGELLLLFCFKSKS